MTTYKPLHERIRFPDQIDTPGLGREERYAQATNEDWRAVRARLVLMERALDAERARTRQLVVDECVAIARAESEDLERDAKSVDGDGIRIVYRTNEVLRLQAQRLTEIADKMLEIRYARVPIRPPTAIGSGPCAPTSAQLEEDAESRITMTLARDPAYRPSAAVCDAMRAAGVTIEQPGEWHSKPLITMPPSTPPLTGADADRVKLVRGCTFCGKPDCREGCVT